MTKYLLQKIRHFWALIFYQPAPEPPGPSPRKGARAWHKARQAEVEANGVWYHLGDLLGQLEVYMRLLRHMRRGDPEVYIAYQKIGGVVQCGSDHLQVQLGELPAPWRHGRRPTFGIGMLFPMENDGRLLEGSSEVRVTPAFGYFWKTQSPPGVEAFRGDTYQVTLLYIREEGRLKAFPAAFWVGVSDGGEVRVLKVFRRSVRSVPRSKKRRGGALAQVPVSTWDYPPVLDPDPEIPSRPPPPEFGVQTFCMLAYLYENATSGLMVRVKKEGIAAAFSIDMLRTPYFFKDRDLEVNESGRRRRIVHIVRTHERKLTGGGKTFVRSHFRGVRRFNWKGFDVNVTMPGLHHVDTKELTASAHALDPDKPLPRGMVSWDGLADRVSQHLEV